MTTELTPAAQAFWNDFCQATGESRPLRGVDQFGDEPAMADELIQLVIDGTKRATCCLARDFTDEPLPTPGDLWIMTDGHAAPRCIIETTHVELKPIREVTAEFAFIEGEGDKSLAFWKAAHDAYYTRQGAREGFTYDDSMIGVCEQFRCIWPDKKPRP